MDGASLKSDFAKWFRGVQFFSTARFNVRTGT